jgi:hypothetical protein
VDVINTGHRPTPSQGVPSAHGNKQSVSKYFDIYSEGYVHLRIWVTKTNLKVRVAITSDILELESYVSAYTASGHTRKIFSSTPL